MRGLVLVLRLGLGFYALATRTPPDEVSRVVVTRQFGFCAQVLLVPATGIQKGFQF